MSSKGGNDMENRCLDARKKLFASVSETMEQVPPRMLKSFHNEPKVMTLGVPLTQKELDVLTELSMKQALPMDRIMIQGLRLYQLQCAGYLKQTGPDLGPKKSPDPELVLREILESTSTPEDLKERIKALLSDKNE